MAMKIKVWIDSGANYKSKLQRIIDLELETGITDEEWESMPQDSRDEAMRYVAFKTLDWGYRKVF